MLDRGQLSAHLLPADVCCQVGEDREQTVTIRWTALIGVEKTSPFEVPFGRSRANYPPSVRLSHGPPLGKLKSSAVLASESPPR